MLTINDDWNAAIWEYKKSYEYFFDPEKDWVPLLSLAVQLCETYDDIKKDQGFDYANDFDWSVQKWLVGLQGEFLFQYMFGDARNFKDFNFEVFQKTGDGGIDAKLFRKNIEIKTSEFTKMPREYETCLCGEPNKGERHHLLAFPDHFARGKYRLGDYKDVAFLFKTKNLQPDGCSMDLSQIRWVGPYYKVELCGFRSVENLMEEIRTGKREHINLKSGKNYAWCEKEMLQDFNALRDWIKNGDN